MSGIGRIGAAGAVSRDTPSGGHEAVARSLDGKQSAPPRNEKVLEAARMYEKQFLGEMMKAMRSTVSPADKPSMGEGIFREQLDSQYVDAWGEQGGIGLSDMIYDQIMERYFGGADGKMKELRQQGPVKLSDRDVSRVTRIRPSEAGPVSNQLPLRVDVKSEQGSGAVQVKSPWAGEVISKNQMDAKTALTLEHGQGLRSTLIFDGVATAGMEPGQKVEQGKTVGLLSPEMNSFFWNLNRQGEQEAGAVQSR